MKEMQSNVELFDKYKKEENKIKNRQAYLLRSIVKFIENLSTCRIYEILPKGVSYEEVMEIIQRFSVYSGGVVCWRSIRVLSLRASRNVFLEEALKVIKGSKV
jgi:hypothetical protein